MTNKNVCLTSLFRGKLSRMKHYLATITAIIFWSASVVGTKIAYRSFSPLLLCLIRFIISLVFLHILRVMRHDDTRMKKEYLKPVILSALLGISIYYALENIGISLTTASDASLISGSYPAITALLGYIVYHDRITRKQSLGIFISIIGVAVLTSYTSAQVSPLRLLGNILLIIDGFLWGFYNYLTQSVTDQYDTVTLTYYQILFGTVMLAPFVLIEHPSVISVSVQTIAAVLFLSLGCTVSALMLYNYGLSGIPAYSASVILNLMPVFGVLFSFMILHETITFRQLIGGIIILAGVRMSIRK